MRDQIFSMRILLFRMGYFKLLMRYKERIKLRIVDSCAELHQKGFSNQSVSLSVLLVLRDNQVYEQGKMVAESVLVSVSVVVSERL